MMQRVHHDAAVVRPHADEVLPTMKREPTLPFIPSRITASVVPSFSHRSRRFAAFVSSQLTLRRHLEIV